MGKAFDMGDTQNPDRFPGDAPKASQGSFTATREQDSSGLWSKLAQLVGHADIEDYYIWWEKGLTYDSCIRYHARAEGGQPVP